ncbi:CD3324 family protein [Viridibacillus sp. NPDC096237]|uniref:CD3324 family protein n=1 Tax=Viridibacillus sp. NPDC096237 TaxID=3390721 RepID=UPI003D02948C
MRYVNAQDIIPQKLLAEIQQYVQGGLLYIPKPEKSRVKWGVHSGERERLSKRNALIRDTFRSGSSLNSLAKEFNLSVETIKKIIYTK